MAYIVYLIKEWITKDYYLYCNLINLKSEMVNFLKYTSDLNITHNVFNSELNQVSEEYSVLEFLEDFIGMK